MSKHILVECVLSRLALVAVKCFENVVHLLVSVCTHCRVNIFWYVFKLDIELRLADFLLNTLNESDNLLNLLVTEENCAEHFLFGDFVRTGFNHHDSVLSTAEVERELGLCTLLCVGVNDVLAVNHTDYNRTSRTCPRNIGN